MKNRIKFPQSLHSLMEHELRLLKKKRKLFQIKLFFTLILPTVLALLAIKVFQTFLCIQLKEISIGSKQQKEKKTVRSVVMIRRKPDFITPESIPSYSKDL